MLDHDFELEKSNHPENFEPAIDERGDDSAKDLYITDDDLPDVDMLHDLNAELDHDLPTKEEVLTKLANDEEKEQKITERMDRVEDQKFRWGEPKQK